MSENYFHYNIPRIESDIVNEKGQGSVLEKQSIESYYPQTYNNLNFS